MDQIGFMAKNDRRVEFHFAAPSEHIYSNYFNQVIQTQMFGNISSPGVKRGGGDTSVGIFPIFPESGKCAKIYIIFIRVRFNGSKIPPAHRRPSYTAVIS